MKKISSAFYSFLLAMLLTGCATVTNPATQKKEYILINSLEEVQIGRSMSETIVKKEIPPLDDPAKQLAVNRIGNRIVQASDRKEIVYHFMILDSPDLNAFALPGGYVYIYNGLLGRVDEQALAAVLAHEVGHVAAKHSIKKLQAALGYDLLMGIALVGLGNKDPQLAEEVGRLSNTVYDLLSRGYSRQDELLADRLAVKYLSQAGFDPHAMVRVLEILQKEKGPGGRVFEILSTHPRMEERIKKVKEEIEKRPKDGIIKK
jgi:predicted Zn-dependent protease